MAAAAQQRLNGTKVLAPAIAGLYWWGLANCALLASMVALPFLVARMQQPLIASVFFWTLMSWKYAARRFVPPAGIVGALVLQGWLMFCNLRAEVLHSRAVEFNQLDYLIISYVLAAVQTAFMVRLYAPARTVIGNIFFGFLAASAIVGILQFLKFGPALAVSELFLRGGLQVYYEVGTAIRAFGLTGSIGDFAYACVVGLAFVIARLFSRPLYWYEYGFGTLFLLGGVVSQSRVALVGLAVCVICGLVIAAIRLREKGLLVVIAAVAGMFALFVAGAERLSYTLSTNLRRDAAFEYRRDVAWPRATRVISDNPVFGIGTTARPLGALVITTREGGTSRRFPTFGSSESQFLTYGIFGGYPAIGLLAISLGLLALGAFRLFLDKRAHLEDRGYAFAMLVVILLVTTYCYLGNVLAKYEVNLAVFTMAGLCVPAFGRSHKPEKLARSLREPGTPGTAPVR